MTTFVLVPGAWLGAWAWRDVTDLLVKAGHDVHPLTLTGLAERAGETGTVGEVGESGGVGETGDSIGLDTHINDITRVLDDRDLRDVVLVAHSYSGAPVTGAADRRPERVAALVYVDSGPVPDGVAQADFNPPDAREAADRSAAMSDGWLAPIAFDPAADPVTLAGLDETMLSGLRARATPHPYATMTQRQHLTGAVDSIPKTLIACTIPLDVVREMIESGNPFFAGLRGATLLTLPTGHWPMFSEPDALAEMLATTRH